MKLVTLLSATAVAGLGLSIAAPFVGLPAAGVASATALAMLLLVIARDYAPRRPLWTPRTRSARVARATEAMKLAA